MNSFSAGSAGDSFATLPGGLVVGNGATLGLLDRSSNFNPGAGTIIQNTDGGLPTSQHLGSAADLLIGLVANFSGDLALGNGTPWFGIVGNLGSQQIVWTGNITAKSNISLQNLSLGNGTAGSFSVVGGPTPVTVQLGSATLTVALANYSGAGLFVAKLGEIPFCKLPRSVAERRRRRCPWRLGTAQRSSRTTWRR